MTDNTQPEALRLANILRGIDARSRFANERLSSASDALENQHARITELESQLAQRFDAADMATAAKEVVPADQDDSLHLCASDLQHSAIYDNHVEMQSCMRAVADRITALAPAQPVAEPAEVSAVESNTAVARMKPRKIDECYGDCPTNPATCPNPCKFLGRTTASHGQAPAQPAPSPAPAGVQWQCGPQATAFGGCPACGSKQCVAGECSRPTPDMMEIINGLADRAAQADSVQEDALSDSVRTPLDSLHADAAYLIGRLRDGSMPYVRVIEIIRERIDAASPKAQAAPTNPHWDYLKRYWQMGFDGVSLDACTGDAPIKAWHEGKAARASATPAAQAAQADSVLEDAARYQWLRRCKGQEHEPPFTVQHEIDGTLWGGDLDAAIDVARKQGANHDN